MKRKPKAQRPRAAPRKRPTLAQVKQAVARRRAIFLGVGAAIAVLLLATSAIVVGFGAIRPPAGAAIEVDWPDGLDSAAAAQRLVDLGLIDDREAMTLFLKATGGTSDFIAGPHLLYRGASPWQLRRMLSRSMLRASAKLVVPEGFNRFDIAARLEKQKIASKRAFLAASSDPALLAELGLAPPAADSAEGFLFPATYELQVDSDARDVVRRLVEEFVKRWDALAKTHEGGIASAKAALGFGRFELVTMASLVEKEAAVDEERPIIASVFFNRLIDPNFHPKKLQSDPSGMYGCLQAPEEAPSCADFNGKPSAAINHDMKNRYSTYARPGLPPGPIANPGAKSLEAAMAPSATRFFYFVAQGNGHHTFSETLDAHNAAVHGGKP